MPGLGGEVLYLHILSSIRLQRGQAGLLKRAAQLSVLVLEALQLLSEPLQLRSALGWCSRCFHGPAGAQGRSHPFPILTPLLPAYHLPGQESAYVALLILYECLLWEWIGAMCPFSGLWGMCLTELPCWLLSHIWLIEGVHT